jgi:hypothetical protein
MATVTHQMNIGVKVQITGDRIISSTEARRAINRELVRKMGDLITCGEPQLFIDEAESVIYWKAPFLVQPPDDDYNIYPTGNYAMVDALTGEYRLEVKTIEDIKNVAEPIIHRLYPDMEAYLQELEKVVV